MTTRSSDIDFVKIGTWLAVGYVAVKYLLPLLRGAEKARDAIANPIGDAIAYATLPGAVKVNSGVVFPDGTRVNLNKILASGTYINDARHFDWQGKEYELIAPRRADGWFDARKV